MPTYNYVAADASGNTIKGKLTASNDLDLESRLSELGLVVLESKIVKQRKQLFASKVEVRDLILFCVHLEQLEKAGVPILSSLADMRDSVENPVFRDIMADLYESVKNGELLSASLAKRPDVFSDVFVGLIAAGEKTGKMAEAFGHLSHHLKWNEELKSSMKKAIRYPIVLLLVMTCVLTMMMLFVVPQLVDFLTAQGFDLPAHTKALIFVSDVFADYWLIILGGPIAGLFFLSFMYKNSSAIKYKIDGMLLNAPFVGDVILKINLARFTHFFSITFSSGIGVLECLETAANVVSNSVIKEAINFIKQNVADGNSVTRAISATQRFPGLVVRMFKVGEDSGNMEDALDNINFFYDREVNDSVSNMIGMVQPTLTIVMGAMMFWIIAAIFGPLYDSFSKIQF